MDKRIKLILDSLKCPICKSQIDLYDYKQTNRSSQYNFCCVANYFHYRMWFPHWDLPLKIHYDIVDVDDGHHRFRIDQRYLIGTTQIQLFNITEDGLVINDGKENKFKYDQILFDYPNTNRVKIINRLKTILTFQ